MTAVRIELAMLIASINGFGGKWAADGKRPAGDGRPDGSVAGEVWGARGRWRALRVAARAAGKCAVRSRRHRATRVQRMAAQSRGRGELDHHAKLTWAYNQFITFGLVGFVTSIFSDTCRTQILAVHRIMRFATLQDAICVSSIGQASAHLQDNSADNRKCMLKLPRLCIPCLDNA
jgi:hypothetical protein